MEEILYNERINVVLLLKVKIVFTSVCFTAPLAAESERGGTVVLNPAALGSMGDVRRHISVCEVFKKKKTET
jgi:hypothetical protein